VDSRLPDLLRQVASENTDLSIEERASLEALLLEFSDVFAIDAKFLRCANLKPHEIHLKPGTRPWTHRLRRASPEHRAEIRRQVRDLLEAGLISPADGEYASPLVLVKKKTGEYRMCVDYRMLNERTIRDVYTLPRISDALDLLSKHRFYSCLDAASGFFQCPLRKEDRKYAAFRVPDGGFFTFNCGAFGMVNMPATYQRAMDNLFAAEKWKSVFIYLDDLVAFSLTFSEHLSHLRTVFERARSVNLKFKLSKCTFAQREIKYLGHVVTADTIRPDPELTRKMREFPRPVNKKSVSSFVSCGGFYRRFIRDFAKKSHALQELTKDNSKWKWSDEEECSFQDLRAELASRPVVAQVDWDKPFVVECDASDFALGAVLSQLDDDGRSHPCYYLSRRLTTHERKYCIREKEQLAVVWACKKLRPYLIHRPFSVITDHKSLEYLHKQKLSDMPPRLARWLLSLSELSFTVHHRANKDHVVPDLFSRTVFDGFLKNPDESSQEDVIEIYAALAVQKPSEAEMKAAQLRHPVLGDIYRLIEVGRPVPKSMTDSYCGGKYSISDSTGLLQITRAGKGTRVIVPPEFVQTFISLSHDTTFGAHVGMNKVLRKLNNNFFWQDMKKTVRAYVASCVSCQKRKPANPKRHGLMQTFAIGGPFYIVVIDIIGPFPLTARGYRYVVNFFCKFTRWCESVCIPDATAASVANAFVNEVICRHGIPRTILSDQGSHFTANLFRFVNKRLSIPALMSTAEHHQTCGSVERYHKFLKDALYAMVDKTHSDWDLHVQSCAFAYRTSVVEGLSFSPFELVYGRPAITPLEFLYSDPIELKESEEEYGTEVLSRLQDSYHIVRQEQMRLDKRRKDVYDRNHIPVVFSPGEFVLLWTPPRAKPGQVTKFLPRYSGPHTVLKRESELNYRIRDNSTRRIQTVHVQRLVKFRSRKTELVEPPPNVTPPKTDPPPAPLAEFSYTSKDGSFQILKRRHSEHGPQLFVEQGKSMFWLPESQVPAADVRAFTVAMRAWRRSLRSSP